MPYLLQMLAVDVWRHVVEFTHCCENCCLRLVSRMFRSVLTAVCCIHKPGEQPVRSCYTNLFVHCSLSADQVSTWIGHTRKTVIFQPHGTSDTLLMHHVRLALEKCDVVVRVRDTVVKPTPRNSAKTNRSPRGNVFFCCVENGVLTATFMDEVRSLLRESNLYCCTIQLSRCHVEPFGYFRSGWYDSFFLDASRYQVTLEHLTGSTVYMCLQCLLHGIKASNLSLFRVHICQQLTARDLIGCITQVVYFLQYCSARTVVLSFDGLHFESQQVGWEIEGLAMTVRQLMCLRQMSVTVKFQFQSSVCHRLVHLLRPQSASCSFSVTVLKTQIVMQSDNNEKNMQPSEQAKRTHLSTLDVVQTNRCDAY